MCLSKQKLEELDSDSTDIFQKNDVDRYTERPHNPEIIDNMCLASFISLYEKDYRPSENDSQPIELDDQLLNENHIPLMNSYPRNLTLLNSEKMKGRKVGKVLRFYVPNSSKHPEDYAHHVLMLYFPYRNESNLLTNNSYLETLRCGSTRQVVESNKRLFEPYSDMIDDAFLNYREVLQPDPILNMENDETEELFSEHSNEENSDDDSAIPSKCPSAVIPSVVKDEEISKRVQSLNTQQREVFELVHAAAKRHLKNLNCMKPRKLTCLTLFLTGFAGNGKSFVVRLYLIIYPSYFLLKIQLERK